MKPTIPLILDDLVLTEIARGDAALIELIQRYDALGQPLVVPALAITGAYVDTRTEDAAALLEGIVLMEQIELAPLSTPRQALELADIQARTGLGPYPAHVAQVADAATCPILTLDASRWTAPSAALENPLYIIEIADPGEPHP
jgi:hypothetical protein